MAALEDFYQTIQKKWFGNAQTVVNVRIGPNSLLSLAVHPSYEDAEINLYKRKEFQDIVKINSQSLIVFIMNLILPTLKIQ